MREKERERVLRSMLTVALGQLYAIKSIKDQERRRVSERVRES